MHNKLFLNEHIMISKHLWIMLDTKKYEKRLSSITDDWVNNISVLRFIEINEEQFSLLFYILNCVNFKKVGV